MIALDRRAAARATVVALVVALGVSTAQVGVAAVATSGQQPMAVADTVPRQATAPAWSEAPSRTVQLSRQRMALPFGGGSVDELTVRAMGNESHVAIKLSWTDPTNDTSIAAPRSYADAAAVMLRTGSQPPITMGAAGTPVDIWYWRASWEYGPRDGTADWTGDMYAYPHPNETTKPGAAAGNPLSKREYDRLAQNYYAKGYGSLSHAPAQNVRADATRTADGWEVVFVRERSTDGQYDASLNGEQVYLAFAVWNGSADEVNGQKSITLQFSTLDPSSGELAAAGGGSGGGGGASGGGGATAASTGGDAATSGDAPFISEQFRDGLLAVLVATVVAWAFAYRSIRRDG
ncbi:ethylbenzene dehydrogenase-related protein [Haloplanus halophilus]|uniref:ethylbenzene dehydrogenase-related protein n=1 Tax=Haloplanus halophilus TaxID=2949993 RepID=UPI0020408BCA|nr:ethylbenzene dehydrogenase-related protein [Haloplanus sp. GDY1]